MPDATRGLNGDAQRDDADYLVGLVGRLREERLGLTARLREIDDFLSGLAKAARQIDGHAQPTRPQVINAVPIQSGERFGTPPVDAKPGGIPGRVLEFIEKYPGRVFKASEVVRALFPHETGEELKHVDMLVRSALSKLVNSDPPRIGRGGRKGDGLYQSLKGQEVT